MRRIAESIAKSVGRLSRLLGRGGGTTLPGVVLLKLRPDTVREHTAELARGVAIVSATNGKTTTARMIRSVVDQAGWHPVANTAGSNLLRGIAAALLGGTDDADFGLFEVDEAALPAVVDQSHPRVLVMMNLFRDQLDRYGELESLVALWAAMIAELPAETILVLNADDPAVAHLGHNRDKVVYFGLDDRSQARSGLAHAADSTHCPRCDQPLVYDVVTIGHFGHWACPECGLGRPTPAVSVRSAVVRGLSGTDVTIDTPAGLVVATLAVPGLHNAYNAGAATAAAHALRLDPATIAEGLATTHAAFGRGERVDLDEREVFLLLAKNPAGANENVRTTLLDPSPLDLLVMLNDRTADGQDVSWIWDVDYEPLFDAAASVVISGDRAYDMALRFKYGGCPADLIAVEPDVAKAVDLVIERSSPGATVYALPTYTAMLDLRAELVRRGAAHDFWDDV